MENPNSVAFIARISEIKEIPGADNIAQAFIGGWSCIVKKGADKVGDLVICTTTDAVIPEAIAEEMNITNYLRNGNRVRTVKLRGVYSECLLLPMRFVPKAKNYKEGADVMEVLGIVKYEAPAKNIQLASGKKIRYSENPNFLVYYKFPNIKNVSGIFTEEDDVQMTRKLHGTNARYGIVKKNKLSIIDRVLKFLHLSNQWAGYEFVVGSHNCEKGSDSQGFYDTNVWYDIAKKLNLKNKLWDYVKLHNIDEVGSGITLYGEIYGAGIQKNYDYGLKEIEFAAFDLMENGKYLNTNDAKICIEGMLMLKHVPVLYEGKWSQAVQDSFTLKNFIPGTKVPEEGIVIKHVSGERQKIAKVINPDYLIYGEKNDVGDSH